MVKRIYIAGPMRGIPLYNFPAFDFAKHVLAVSEETHELLAVSPADIDRGSGFDPEDMPADWNWDEIHPSVGTKEEVIERDFRAIRTCDAIYMLQGWENSTGARAEAALAEWMGLEFFYEDKSGFLTKALPKQEPLPATKEDAVMRQFETGATRNIDANKLDFEGFLSPLVLESFATYMHSHRIQKDGNMRASDNWQKGIPIDVYMKSLWRHFFDVWKQHRGLEAFSPDDGHKLTIEEALNAMLFNTQGYLHELLKNSHTRLES